MNIDEEIVFRFLKKHFVGEIIYEPDGNNPPDFLLNQEIAIEARRLNQNYFDDNSVEGLEDFSFSFEEMLSDVLASFYQNVLEKSFLVSVYYDRQNRQKLSRIRAEIRTALQNFLKTTPSEFPVDIIINKSIQLRIYKNFSTKIYDVFNLCGIFDADNGGEMISELDKNLNFCIEEKNKAVTPYIQNYSIWWLCLVNHLIVFPEYQYSKNVMQSIKSFGPFSKLLIVDIYGNKLLESDCN